MVESRFRLPSRSDPKTIIMIVETSGVDLDEFEVCGIGAAGGGYVGVEESSDLVGG